MPLVIEAAAVRTALLLWSKTRLGVNAYLL